MGKVLVAAKVFEIVLVREKGLEPPRLTTLDPKSSVSTNFTTPAVLKDAVNNNMIYTIIQD